MTIYTPETTQVVIAQIETEAAGPAWVRPYTGLKIEVVGGKKYRGVRGTVVRHIKDKYDRFWSYYQSGTLVEMRERNGYIGYVVWIEPDQPDADGNRDRFWVKAEYIKPI